MVSTSSTTSPADHRPRGCWCSPAASPTSATSRCGRAGGWPRRCATPASRSTSATPTRPAAGAERVTPDCVVPLLHGETGEDGALREVLELVGVPYVGRPDACRAAFDKPVAKTVVPGPACAPPRR